MAEQSGALHVLDEVTSRESGLIVGHAGNTGVVLFDRPDRANAFDRAMLIALESAWTTLGRDPSIRCLVLGATSDRFFCAGRDLKEASDEGGLETTTMAGAPGTGFTSRIAGAPQPLVCAVDGKAVGGGLDFVLDADIVVAGQDALFIDPHVSVGYVSCRESLGLAARIGMGQAMYLSLMGRGASLGASRACELGLVQEVTHSGGALRRALEIAEVIGSNSPSAVQRTLETARFLTRASGYDLALQFGMEQLLRQRTHPDSLEGPRAFVEGRSPAWK